MKCIDRNDDSKNRCPLGGRFKFLITILKTFSVWIFGSLFLCAHKIFSAKGILSAIFVLIILTAFCGAERSPETQKKGKVISKTCEIITVDSTANQEPKVSKKEEAKTLKSNEEIAKEVILGLWGNGKDRNSKLKASGYDPDAIQKIVDTKVPKITRNLVFPKSFAGQRAKNTWSTRRFTWGCL